MLVIVYIYEYVSTLFRTSKGVTISHRKLDSGNKHRVTQPRWIAIIVYE